MSFSNLLYQTSDHVCTITLNRPDRRNALNGALVEELHRALHASAEDANVRVLVLTGAGDAFCAGADLEYLLEISTNSPLENAADSQALMEMLLALKSFPKPTIAMVHGPAIAGGCGLMLTCDIIVADDEAKLGFSEVRIGFVPAIVTKLLTDRIGSGNARELLLRGHIIDADVAQDIGMINYVVGVDELDSMVAQLAREIVTKTSPQAVRLTKRLLADIEPLAIEEAMRHAASFNAIARTTDDFRKGIESFLNKQKPDWE